MTRPADPILLVEDNPDDAELTKRALARHRVKNPLVHVQDGVAALDYVYGTGQFAGRDVRVQPQLILLDLKLPKIDGLEVLRRLRADERTRLLPVVVMTSSREEEDLVKSYSLGANSYVRKPIDFADFAEAIRTLSLYWLILNERAPVRT
jgi:CheY-like chemotaxis protein